MNDRRGGEILDRSPQREMDSHRDDPQSGADKHHHRGFGGPGKHSEKLGMSRVLEARTIKAFLVDGIGDECGGAPTHYIANSGLYRADDSLCVRGIGVPRPGAQRDPDRCNRKGIAEYR